MNRKMNKFLIGFLALLTLFIGIHQPLSADCKHTECEIKSGTFPGSAENNNVSISYLTAGNKKNPLVLLIHGNGGTADSWRGVMKKMCKDFYLVAPYRRGTLPSGQPNTGNMDVDYSLSITATDFQLVLQQLGVQNPNIIAHSYSGRFAAQYYFQYNTDPVYAPVTMTMLAISFTGNIKGPGSLAINAATAAGDLDGIAAAFRDYAVTVQCACLSPKVLAKLQQQVYEGALQTSLYAYQSYLAVAGLPSSNFVPGSVNIPTIPFGPTPVPGNPSQTFANILIPVYVVGGSQDQINAPVNNTQSPSVDLAILATLFPNNFVEELRGVPHFAMLTNYKVLAEKFTGYLNNINEPCSICSSKCRAR